MKSKGASKTKSGGRLDYNWDSLSRDDIYRQRVYGTESGANNFIQTDDKKQRSVPGLWAKWGRLRKTSSPKWKLLDAPTNLDV